MSVYKCLEFMYFAERDMDDQLFNRESKQECMITKTMQMDAKMAYDSLPKQETLEEAAREYWKRGQFGLEKAADTERAFLRGGLWQAERMYSEEEVINLLETQRGNSYVAVLSATKNDELASIALNAPEPGGMKKFKKK